MTRFFAPHLNYQTLSSLDRTSSGFRRCLCELGDICGTRTILPISYVVSSPLGLQPIALWGSDDVYEGTLDGSKVCVKRVRVYSEGVPKKTTKVRY